ncbi:MAG: serine hydrolase [Verrucomicrobia bacterium]|nr:serine hydrolase [Verrucomicrobiota bacterium]
MTTETLFPVGSVTKIFTGIMLAHLVQEGAVGLEDPVVHYLPAEIGRSGGAIRQVTLLDLATHTSGMTDGAPGNPAEQVYFDLPPLPNLVRDWIRWSPTPPNTGDPYLYHYSNKGYLTLAFAVAQAGQRGGYNPLFQEVFRDPLGLRYLQTLGTMTPTFRALLTSSYGDREDPKDKVGNGVNANLLDLEPFLQACLLNQGTPPRLRQAIEFSQRPFRSKLQSDSRQRMGLGWDLSLAPPLTISKDGATAGAFSHLQLQPQENVGVMVMANGKPSTGNDIGRVAADLMALVQRHGDRELARGRPTRHSSGTGRSRPNDGHKTGATVWAAAGPEDWWEVDLEFLRSVGYLHVLTAWDGTNAYPYRIHTSFDRLAWTLAVDATQPPEPATLAGDRHRIPRLARHVRVQSAGAPLRLVEVEVFRTPGPRRRRAVVRSSETRGHSERRPSARRNRVLLPAVGVGKPIGLRSFGLGEPPRLGTPGRRMGRADRAARAFGPEREGLLASRQHRSGPGRQRVPSPRDFAPLNGVHLGSGGQGPQAARLGRRRLLLGGTGARAGRLPWRSLPTGASDY